MLKKISLALVLALTATVAPAKGLSVSPLGLDVRGGERTEVLRLKNQGQEPLGVQVRAFSWSQQKGQDILVPTRDVLASPQIATIAPGQEQVVRLVLPAAKPGEQRSYRLFVDELPAKRGEGPRRLKILLRYSLPLFVSNLPSAPVQLSFSAPNGNLQVINQGNQAAKLVGLTVAGKPLVPGLLGYVLPGATMEFGALVQPGQRLELEANGQATQAIVK